MSRDLFLSGGSNTTKMYDLSLEKFEMSYIEKTTDVKELEKIIKVLRSGAEGSYPHLEQAAEKRLQQLDPDSRALRKTKPIPNKKDLPSTEQDRVGSEINEFLDDISNVDRLLRKQPTNGQKKDEMPVRTAVRINKENIKSTKSPKPRDYSEWDKLEKSIDENELELEKEPSDEKGTKHHADIATEVDVSGKSDVEKSRLAEMDKEKGNEYFHAGDYDSAIVYYTRSLSIIPSPASYNNRALVYLKCEKYSRCIADCDAVLDVEANNVKALLRRGSSYKAQSEYSKAKRDFSRVIQLEPHNLRANKLLKETENAWRTKGKKLQIDEVESEPIVEDEKRKRLSDTSKLDNESNNNRKLREDDHKHVPNGEIVENGLGAVKTKDTEMSEPEPTKQKPRRIVIEENDSDEEEEGTTVVVEEADVKPVLRTEGTTTTTTTDTTNTTTVTATVTTNKEISSASDAASVKTASTDISSDSDLTSSSDTSPVHQHSAPQRPILITVPLPAKLAELKTSANDAFRSGQFARAQKIYDQLIDKLSKMPEQVVNLATIYNNRATTHFKIGDCRASIEDCNKSLTHVPHSVKALVKRGQAFEALEKYKEAYRDFQHVLVVDTSVDHAQQGLGRCRSMLFREYGKVWRSKVPDVTVNTNDIPLIIPESGIWPPSEGQRTPVMVQTKEPAMKDVRKKTDDESAPSTATKPTIRATIRDDKQTTKVVENNGKSTKPKPEHEKIAPKESPESRHENLKVKGNGHVGKSEFKQAIDCYTQCLDIFQDRSAIHSNRALCYLKTHQAEKAIADCDKAIELDENNVKAWFRRAQARKMRNDYRNCMSDLLQVLRIDANNGAAKKELDVVKKAYHDRFAKEQKERKEEAAKKDKGAKKESSHKKKPLIEIVSESKRDETEAKKAEPPTSKVGTATQEQRNKKDSHSKKTKKHAKVVEEEKVEESTPDCPIQQNVEGKKVKEPRPDFPILKNKESPYEFMQAWNTLKSRQDFAAHAGLLGQIQPRLLSKLIGNKVDYDILSTIVMTIHDHTLEEDVARAYHLLYHLKNVERFGMALMFMSNLDKISVNDVLDKMATSENCPGSKSDIAALRKAYKV